MKLRNNKWCEIDPDYYKSACERIDIETRQKSFLYQEIKK